MGNLRRHIVALLIVLALLAPGIAFSLNASASNTTKEVMFSASDPTNTVTLSSSVQVTYDDKVEIYHGEEPSISYNVQPGDLVLTLKLKLSALHLGLDDETITVPITDTQLLNQGISLTEYLTGVPSSLASINMVIKTKVSMDQPIISSTQCSLTSSPQSMTWGQWGSKTFTVDSSADSRVQTHLNYQITVGVVATVLQALTGALSATLIPDTVITSTAGNYPLVTTVDVRNDETTSLFMGSAGFIGLVLIVLGVVVVVVILASKHGRTKNAPPTMASPPQMPVQNQIHHRYCSNCGQRMSDAASYCPRCGGRKR
jgi:hypothetical protein